MKVVCAWEFSMLAAMTVSQIDLKRLFSQPEIRVQILTLLLSCCDIAQYHTSLYVRLSMCGA